MNQFLQMPNLCRNKDLYYKEKLWEEGVGGFEKEKREGEKIAKMFFFTSISYMTSPFNNVLYCMLVYIKMVPFLVLFQQSIHVCVLSFFFNLQRQNPLLYFRHGHSNKTILLN